MAIVYIGIGSNIGNRQANCAGAVEELKSKGITVKKISSMHETEPWGLKEQPKFINMAVEAETSMSPEELLSAIKDIEEDMGRKETVKWGPRIMDLDILFYDDIVIDMEHLHIPHPLLHKRDFVLNPLSEIAPGKLHPVLRKTVDQLKEALIRD
ncbi:MAG TPA: 2-amino-4-hydroxy-6-hydroxymethyldihydropteridine diphosphokinase [Nitrospiraceae bacterium]|nr:MAG: 2-amino-4-hydroxy-6-hydroxymethyldihydropteridine diphosphokinase [Nitrospirae bacterium GWA2_46_11]OGW24828.1 MAG: 2-amino-4-hydroxy-6-hydroxymethyldihydropteridine diphosphokinase [Nitrospirae bacterium GWB2_47_37]HAK88155.1 2-amino-4-hydroxy-6-hydroxymethyldihydropteridine diphosphokinase [Nitrospiraceae bacterium]HCZ11892.1 2-amino-4-hydroxy-6-hydroxymethyldihydropteridine diphosphokinase [Nitrospiraceae bacterium]